MMMMSERRISTVLRRASRLLLAGLVTAVASVPAGCWDDKDVGCIVARRCDPVGSDTWTAPDPVGSDMYMGFDRLTPKPVCRHQRARRMCTNTFFFSDTSCPSNRDCKRRTGHPWRLGLHIGDQGDIMSSVVAL